MLPYNSVGEIDDVIYSDLLPGSRDYFHHEGKGGRSGMAGVAFAIPLFSWIGNAIPLFNSHEYIPA